MKTLAEVLTQEPVYMNDFKSKFDVVRDFEDVYISESDYHAEEAPYANEDYWRKNKAQMKAALEAHEGDNILFASYGNANYSGDAFVLFEKHGELFEVHGGHCSCYGLEGQWSPEPTTLEVLEHRLTTGTFGEDDWSDNNFKQELCEFLGVEFKRNMQSGWN